jgi:hypothetical protein
MKTIAAYTNLELSDDIEDDYDALCESGLLNSVVNSFIGEYENVSMLLQMRCEYILFGNSIESQVGRFLDGILDKLDGVSDGFKNMLEGVDLNSILGSNLTEDNLSQLKGFLDKYNN